MFHWRRNQVVGFFTSKMLEKHPWKSDILSKDAGRPAFLLKMSLFYSVFQTFC